jgi:Uncharacterized conserved protein
VDILIALAYFLFFLFLLAIGFVVGSFLEKRHYKSIEEREAHFLNMPAVTGRHMFDPQAEISHTAMVQGSAVISLDYFKLFFASLKSLLGGQISAYETLVDRARREAILRMKESAGNADLVLNLRLETSNIGTKSGNNKVGCVEVLAYGTAVTYRSNQ